MTRGIFPRRKAPDNLPRAAHWAATAVCRSSDADPDVWFPDPTDAVGIGEAKRHCRLCPVLIQCRTDALNRPERFGVWGGLDEAERAAVLKRRRADARAEAARQQTAEVTAGELAPAS
ncbi:Transcriptional regulator WhiB1 [Streptomyces sp. 111WW2]|uniref:WhiB family transcriptional regulator n=1 Tax=Streptomyces sp. 111WW2 TaxID=1945515 RepID=UPI000D0C901E|nr:WhiB family transcriptional regulator [Streptomyces sp. 111WW2]PSK52407.1 Transcriptional regulator WhiB1 [Streptomyces sp. 111WW2]